MAAPKGFDAGAGAVVGGAVVITAAVEGVPNLNKLGAVLGAVALVLGAAVVVEVPDRDGKRDEVGPGVEVGCVVLPSPPKRLEVPAGAAVVEVVA